jgi:hypothetical protein
LLYLVRRRVLLVGRVGAVVLRVEDVSLLVGGLDLVDLVVVLRRLLRNLMRR